MYHCSMFSSSRREAGRVGVVGVSADVQKSDVSREEERARTFSPSPVSHG